MTARQQFLAMTATAALLALPVLALAQTSPSPNPAAGPAGNSPAGGVTPALPPAQPTPATPPAAAGNSASSAGKSAAPPSSGGTTPAQAPAAQPNPATGTDRAANATTQTMPSPSPLNMAVDQRTLREGRRASKVIGASVYNDAGETIGQVDDILIPRENGPPVAIISVGGFLGIGAKLVAVPYDNLRMGESRWTLPGATKESLNALPGFSYEAPKSG